MRSAVHVQLDADGVLCRVSNPQTDARDIVSGQTTDLPLFHLLIQQLAVVNLLMLTPVTSP